MFAGGAEKIKNSLRRASCLLSKYSVTTIFYISVRIMKRKERPDWDDGRVIAPMNGDELPFYRRIFASKRKGESSGADKETQLTKKEKRALTRATFLQMLPMLLITLLGFGLAAGLIALWLL